MSEIESIFIKKTDFYSKIASEINLKMVCLKLRRDIYGCCIEIHESQCHSPKERKLNMKKFLATVV